MREPGAVAVGDNGSSERSLVEVSMPGELVGGIVKGKASSVLPKGTVSFLLADIEGSTRAWEAEEEGAVGTAVARFYEILDSAICGNGGVRPVEQGEGDSVVGVFARASDGIAAALRAQKELGTEGWPTSSPLLVRMALHSGEAALRDEGNYFGPVVNRCARLRELAHGGQVLVSRATHDLVADQLPDEVSLRDLGSHRLRDLGRAEEVFQLCHPDLEGEFPALRSLDSRPHNLPAQLTSFIGRETEIPKVRELFVGHRLVTLTGAGGCGKTRLALQVAAGFVGDYPDGVWWVDLAAISDPDLVANTVGAAMGIREVPGESFTATLERVLAERRTLVLLDNCEHLIEACAGLCHVLLRSCPGLVVLATSREPLGVDGETTWRVPSLSVAEGTETLKQSEAVRLFCDRAERARPTFALTEDNVEAVTQICRRLDGIPLAIELAAARIRILDAAHIAAGLDDRFRLLSGGTRTALPRQRTLEASVDWSYNLLDERQRTLFRRLSVFAASFALDSAEAVCSGDGLDTYEVFDLLVQLADRSLVHLQEHPARYRMLETIRHYARQRLADADEADAIRSRHLEHYIELVELAAPLIESGGTVEWFNRVAVELDNVRTALDWSLAGGRSSDGLRLATAWPEHWVLLGHPAEGLRRIEGLIEASDPDPPLLGRSYLSLATIGAFEGGDFESTLRYGEWAVDIAREIGDARLEARALSWPSFVLAYVGPPGDEEPAEKALAAARKARDPWAERSAKYILGMFRFRVFDLGGAQSVFEEVLASAQESGDLLNLLRAHHGRGFASLLEGDLLRAEGELREASLISASVGDRYWSSPINGALGLVAMLRGDQRRARSFIGDANTQATETGNLTFGRWVAFCRALLELNDGNFDDAALIAREAAESVRATGSMFGVSGYTVVEAWAALAKGDADRAVALSEDAASTAETLPDLGYALLVRSTLARFGGDLVESDRLAREATAHIGSGNIYTPIALEALGGVLVHLGNHEEASRLLGAADALRSRTYSGRFPWIETMFQADCATARDALGDEAFDAAWAEGGAMTAEEAVAYATRGRGKRQRPSHGWDSLTPTELEVTRLVAEGLTNPQIAEKLFISRGTVKTHLSHIFAKLGISTRAELATQATRRDL